MTKIEREKMWKSKILEFEQSGKKITEWCSAHNIRVDTFSYWITKEKMRSSNIGAQTEWISLKVESKIPDQSIDSGLTVKIGQASIEIKEGFNSQILLDIASVLGKLC